MATKSTKGKNQKKKNTRQSNSNEAVATSMPATKLNAVQKQLLQLFSRKMSKQELADIQDLLTAYYNEKLQDSFDKVWDEKGWDKSVFDDFLNEHMRSPYRKRNTTQ